MIQGLLVQHFQLFIGQRRLGVVDHHALPVQDDGLGHCVRRVQQRQQALFLAVQGEIQVIPPLVLQECLRLFCAGPVMDRKDFHVRILNLELLIIRKLRYARRAGRSPEVDDDHPAAAVRQAEGFAAQQFGGEVRQEISDLCSDGEIRGGRRGFVLFL